MNWSIRRIAGNVFSLASGEVLQRMLSLMLIMVVARKLGASQMGLYNSCMAYIGNFIILLNFGFDSFIVREASKDPEKANQIFESITGAKSSLYLIIAPIAVLCAAIFLPAGKWHLILIMVVTVLFTITTTTVYAFFRARLLGHFQSVGNIINRLLAAGTGLLLVLAGNGVTGMAFAEMASAMIICFVSMIVLKKTSNIWPRKLFSIKELKLYTKTWKFGFYQILLGISTSSGMMMLPVFASNKAAGLYSSAEKLGMIVSFIPSAISSTMLPVFSRLSTEGGERYKSWLQRYFTLQVIAGSFICALFASTSSFIPGLIYGPEFIQIRPVMLILSPLLICTFVNPVLSIALITKNREGLMLAIFSATTAVNITVGAILIPIFHEKGAAIATLSSNFLLLILQYMCLQPDIRNRLLSFKVSIVPFSAAAACFGIWRFLELRRVSLPVNASAGVAVFVAVIILTRLVRLQDLNEFVLAVRNGKS